MFSKSQLELINLAVSVLPQRRNDICMQQCQEILDTIEGYLYKTSFTGQAYLDIPNKDGESWHNVMTGPAQDALELAVTNYGANEFGFVNLITLGEASKEDEIDEDQDSAT